MSRRELVLRKNIHDLLKNLEEEGYNAAKSCRDYREQGLYVFRLAQNFEPNILPGSTTEKVIYDTHMLMIKRGYSVSTQRIYMHCMRRLCEAAGNFVFDNVHLKYQQDQRITVDWLTNDESKRLLAMEMSPIEEVVIHLLLCHGLRRIELARLKLEYIHDGHIEILGKGKNGGKWRTIPMAPNFPPVLERWLNERNRMIETAKSINPKVVVPDTFLIWQHRGTLSSYSQVKCTGIDKITKKVEERFGKHFGNHTLRRTFGRAMFHSDVKIEVLAMIMGHTKTEQTLKYIGVQLEDMEEAMVKCELFKKD